jgi:predicted PurR-regulated permease PerM
LGLEQLEKGGKALESSVASLLLITSAVVLACVVVTYGVVIVEQTVNMENLPEMDRLLDLQNSLLDQTNSFLNQTLTDLPSANQTVSSP